MEAGQNGCLSLILKFGQIFGEALERDIVTINVDYKWQPQQCSHCTVFGHSLEKCIRKVQPSKSMAGPEEWTRVVRNRKTNKDQCNESDKGKAIVPLRLDVLLEGTSGDEVEVPVELSLVIIPAKAIAPKLVKSQLEI